MLNNGTALASDIGFKPFGGMASLTYGNNLTRNVGYDLQYRVASIETPGIQGVNYSYDLNGNITAITDILDAQKAKSYEYDPLNMLTGADGPWGSLSYEYDGLGNRLKEIQDTDETTYSYQANRLVSSTGTKSYAFTYDANGNTIAENTRSYTYNQNQRLISIAEGDMLGHGWSTPFSIHMECEEFVNAEGRPAQNRLEIRKTPEPRFISREIV